VVEQPLVLLRPGGISRSEIEKVAGPIAQHDQPTAGAHPSPGMHPQHYSPKTPLLLVTGGAVPRSGKGAYLQHRTQPLHEATVVVMPANPREYASQLYAILHQLDDGGYDWLAVEAPEDTAEWEGVLDRLRRAAARGMPRE